MVWQPKWRYVVGHIEGRVDVWDLEFDPTEWVIIRPGGYIGLPIVESYLVTSPAVFGADTAAPPGRVDAPGTDGVGPELDGEDGPARWLLLDGYGHHISDADTGRFHVRELRLEQHVDADLDPDDAAR